MNLELQLLRKHQMTFPLISFYAELLILLILYKTVYNKILDLLFKVRVNE